MRESITKWLALAGITFLLSCQSEKEENKFRMPGEFEPQQAVWLGWQGYDFYYPVGRDMIRSLMPHVPVKVVTESDSVLRVCKAYLTAAQIDTSRISFFVMPDNEFWIRDHGATYTRNEKGQLRAVDFEWATYGYYQWLQNKFSNNVQKADSIFRKSRASKRGQVDSLMAAAERVPVLKSWIKIEGGALETNGQGSLILNEALTLSRNPGVSKDSLEAEFRRVLGVTDFIWLPYSLAEDPHIWGTITGKFVGIGTGGHTDEFVRFADANTIMLAWVAEADKDRHPINQINYQRMSQNLKVLQQAQTAEGKPFNIIKVPLPELVIKPVVLSKTWSKAQPPFGMSATAFKASDGWQPGDTAYRVAASSYLNFYITNGMVLLPGYTSVGTSAEKENRVKQQFQQAFPGRKVVTIEVMPLNWEGGGIHCGTQQQPK